MLCVRVWLRATRAHTHVMLRTDTVPLPHTRPCTAHVRTSHFLLLDVDLWPSTSLSAELARVDEAFWATPLLALLVPAWQLVDGSRRAARAQQESAWEPLETPQEEEPTRRSVASSAGEGVPADFAELRQCVGELECVVFKGRPMPNDQDPAAARMQAVPGQQLSTDYARWMRTEGLPYRIPCFDKVSFEPYLILPTPGRERGEAHDAGGDGEDTRRASDRHPNEREGITSAQQFDTPRFDDRYVGYGKNKVQWVQALRALGYTFWVVPRAFVTHVPHAVTKAGRQWAHNARGHRGRMDALFDEQLRHDAEAEEGRLRREQRQQQHSQGGFNSSSTCTRTLPTCAVPLMQLIDPLNPNFAGRRAATSTIVG